VSSYSSTQCDLNTRHEAVEKDLKVCELVAEAKPYEEYVIKKAPIKKGLN